MVAYNRFVDNIIIKVIDLIISFFVLAVIIVTVMAVIFRYFLKNPLPWAEELTLFGFAWFTFLGAGSAVRKRSVISLDIFYEMMPSRIKKATKFVTTMLCIIAYCFIIYAGFGILKVVGTQYTTALHIGLHFAYISIPIGGIFTIMALIANMFDAFMDIEIAATSESDEAAIQDTLAAQTVEKERRPQR